MRVEFYERGIFKVHCHGEEFTVDVCANRGAGCCDCWHFKRDIKPAIEREKLAGRFDPEDPKWKCPHIEAADRALLHMFKRQLMKQFPDSKEHEI